MLVHVQVMITDAAGKLEYLLGTPGSFGIPQTTTQLICNVLDHGMDMQEAIEAPRVSLPYETEGAPTNESLLALRAVLSAPQLRLECVKE